MSASKSGKNTSLRGLRLVIMTNTTLVEPYSCIICTMIARIRESKTTPDDALTTAFLLGSSQNCTVAVCDTHRSNFLRLSVAVNAELDRMADAKKVGVS